MNLVVNNTNTNEAVKVNDPGTSSDEKNRDEDLDLEV